MLYFNVAGITIKLVCVRAIYAYERAEALMRREYRPRSATAPQAPMKRW